MAFSTVGTPDYIAPEGTYDLFVQNVRVVHLLMLDSTVIHFLAQFWPLRMVRLDIPTRPPSTGGLWELSCLNVWSDTLRFTQKIP